nr:hypothetical protein [Tanacetum cinerariifolium]
MSSASSAVTYTSVYTDSEPGRVFWGAGEELSDGGSLRVIVYRHDGLPVLPVAPPSPDYVPGPEESQTPPAPQDEDEHEPMFIQPHDPDFVPKPIYTEYIPLEDEHVLSAEEQPLPHVVSPIAESPEYVVESDPEEYEDDETEDGPVERLLAMPTPSPSPLASLSPPSAGERLARCTAPAALLSPPLPPPLHMPPPVDHRDDIPETEMLPRKRLCLSTLGSKYEVGESSTARPTRGRGIDYGDTWVDPTNTVPEIVPMTVGEVKTRVTELAELHEHDTHDLYTLLEDAQDRPSTLPNDTNPNNMTPESVQAMIDQALLRNSTNKDGSHSSHEDNRRNVQTACPCFYADFMKCQPLNFKGTEGVVKFATCTLLDAALTWWNSQIRSLGPDAFSMTWEKIHTYAERQTNNKRKADDSFENNHGHQQQTPKRQNVVRVYNIGTSERKPYSGNLPKSSGNTNVANAQRNNGANPMGNGCFECGATGHFKRDCPKLKNKDGGKVNAPRWVYAVRNAEKRGNASRDPDSNVVM